MHVIQVLCALGLLQMLVYVFICICFCSYIVSMKLVQ